jgi:hypothetical protein
MISPLAMPDALSSAAVLRHDAQGNVSTAAVPALPDAPVERPAPPALSEGRGARLDVFA